MTKSFLSSSWYRVADLAPRLRSQAEIHRQRFRGQTWYILQDHQSGKYFRVSPAANLMICLMDGRRTMNELWLRVCETFPEDPPTQDETIRLLSQLHQADLMHTDLAPDLEEIERRAVRQDTRALLQRIRNPLALRFPLVDPDKFLSFTFPLVRWIFTPVGLVLWLALVLAGGTLAVMNFDVLTANLADRVLSAQNFVVLLFIYPVVKAIHELGHGYAAKAADGEVHEMGIMILVLMPIPYVDASAASAFTSKWRRVLVGSAGILVEMALASGAMIFWLYAEPGMARAVAFNVMLIGGVSTLLFNGNPLLRFDGYYVLTDLVEIPNLGQRANRYVFYLLQTYLFGRRDAQNPVTAPGEAGWFLFYSIASFIYRVGISITIALFISGKFFFFGVLIALWAIGNMFIFPLFKGIWFVLSDPALRGRRPRALASSALLAAAPIILLFGFPLPYSTLAEGVVHAPQGTVLHAQIDGFLANLDAPPQTIVPAGAPLVTLEDPALDARVALIGAQLSELKVRLDVARVVDLVEVQALQEQISHHESALAFEQARMADLVLRAPHEGAFLTKANENLLNRFVPKGGEIGYIVRPGDLVLRVVVPQTRVDLVRQRTDGVAVRYISEIERIRSARVLREVTESHELPNRALSTAGGGSIAVDPADPNGTRLLETAFQIDLAPIDPPGFRRIGERVLVRFDHGYEPLAGRFYRALRQLFLSQFDV